MFALKGTDANDFGISLPNTIIDGPWKKVTS